MLSVKLIDQFLQMFKIPHSLPPSVYITVIYPQYNVSQLLRVQDRVKDWIDCPVVKGIEDHWQLFSWPLSNYRKYISVTK